MKGIKLNKPFSQVRINRGNFTPSTTLTPEAIKYGNQRYGWFINFQMNQMQGYFPEIGGKVPIYGKEKFNPVNVDCEQWADEAYKRGVQFVSLTILNEFGFLLYDSKLTFRMPRIQWDAQSGAMSPQHDYPYCVSGQADNNIVEKFCTAFRRRGIDIMFYVISTLNANLQEPSQTNGFVTGERITSFIDWQVRAVQEMVMRFRPFAIWLDTGGTGTYYVQQFYDGIKSVNPRCLLISNTGPHGDFFGYPHDVQTREEYYIINNGDTTYQTTNRTYNGVDYPIIQEVCGIPYAEYSQWYKIDNLCPVQPVVSPFNSAVSFVKDKLISKATYQNVVNSVRAANRPFLAGVWIDRYGKLDMQAVNFLDKIEFGVTRPGQVVLGDPSGNNVGDPDGNTIGG